MLFNEETVHPENLIVVSPSITLDRESDVLLQDLELEKIEKDSLNNLYEKWIRAYIREHSLSPGSNIIIDQPAIENNKVNEDLIGLLYEKNMSEEFDQILYSVLDNPQKEVKGFSLEKEEGHYVEKLMTQIYGGILDQRSETFWFLARFNDEYEKICRTLSKDNVRAKLKSISERIKIERESIGDVDKNQLKRLIEIKNKDVKDVQKLIAEKERELISTFKRAYTPNDSTSKSNQTLSGIERKICQDRIGIIEKEIVDLRKSIDDIQKSYEAQRKEILDDRAYQLLRRQGLALQLFLKGGDLTGDQVKTRTGEFSLSDSLYQDAFNFYKMYIEDSPSELFKHHESVGAFCHENYILMDRIRRHSDFLIDPQKPKGYAIDLIQLILHYWKNTLDLDGDRFYEFELYYVLRGLSDLYGPLSGERKIISVDEYQDYAAVEIDLLGDVFNNSTFNLYGELKQSINPKGLHNVSETIFFTRLAQYGLDINYRNGRQITDYINKCFGTDMTAIGIDSVVDVKSQKDLSVIEGLGQKRIALLVKSEKQYHQMTYEKGKDNYFKDEKTELDKNKLNVIPIRLAKGLEFEDVYVYEEGMSENERYVAYSRALEALHIVR